MSETSTPTIGAPDTLSSTRTFTRWPKSADSGATISATPATARRMAAQTGSLSLRHLPERNPTRLLAHVDRTSASERLQIVDIHFPRRRANTFAAHESVARV